MNRNGPGVELSVVIPAHNAGGVIEETTAKLAARLAGVTAEIIVVENGSTDDTLARCEVMAARWRRDHLAVTVLRSRKGMGNALRAGLESSRGTRVLLTADDLPFGFDDLDAADRLAETPEGIPQVIIGSKAHPESVIERGPLRALLTWGFGVLRWLILGMHTGDPQGTILIDGTLGRELARDVEEAGFLYTTELVYMVERRGIRPMEVPVRLSPSHAAHPSRISAADVAAMALGLVRLRRRRHVRQRRARSVGHPGG